MNKIREDMLKVKRMVSEVEMILGKREGETELVNKLIAAENLLTYCMSRLENAIVLPVKPGDTVYWLDNEKVKQGEVFEISVHSDGILVHTGIQFCLEVENVSLTREEAEKALKERETE